MKRISLLLIVLLLMTSVCACTKKQDTEDSVVESVIEDKDYSQKDDAPQADDTQKEEAPQTDDTQKDDVPQTDDVQKEEAPQADDTPKEEQPKEPQGGDTWDPSDTQAPDKDDTDKEDTELPPPSNYGSDEKKPFEYFEYQDYTCFLDPNVNEVVLYKYQGSDARIVVPDEINGYPVTKIWEYCFRANNAITEVSGGNNIKEIYHRAFAGCEQLKKVILPKGVETVWNEAFSYCPAIEEVWVPKTVVKWDGAFSMCEKLTKVTLEDGIKVIAGGAFMGTGIESVTIPASVTELGWFCFAGCPNLKSVYFEGDAPKAAVEYYDVFNKKLFSQNSDGSEEVTLYYKNGAKGWDTTPFKDFEKIEAY